MLISLQNNGGGAVFPFFFFLTCWFVGFFLKKKVVKWMLGSCSVLKYINQMNFWYKNLPIPSTKFRKLIKSSRKSERTDVPICRTSLAFKLSSAEASWTSFPRAFCVYVELPSPALSDKDLTVKQCQTCFHRGTNLQFIRRTQVPWKLHSI